MANILRESDSLGEEKYVGSVFLMIQLRLRMTDTPEISEYTQRILTLCPPLLIQYLLPCGNVWESYPPHSNKGYFWYEFPAAVEASAIILEPESGGEDACIDELKVSARVSTCVCVYAYLHSC
jgi:hypothetical protein